eukprot:augustus_masked-scaffold_77-processed-gene-0.11-mRNA-1 protein AED:0.44 eAED:0.44 QI:0/-1/0/1/-1/1/1/0/251
MLRSNGDTDFEDISLEVPWDILALDCGQDLETEQKFQPKLYKSHEKFSTIAKGGKYILVIRNPFDAFISFYRFLPGFFHVNEEEVSMEEFSNALLGNISNSGTIFNFVVDWLQAYKEKKEDILCLFYEDIKENPEDNIRRIAKYMGIDSLGEVEFEKRIEIAKKYSSFKYMSENISKFDEHFIFNKRKEVWGPDLVKYNKPGVAKVRKGKTGVGSEIPDSVKRILEDSWKHTVQEKLGYKSYEELVKDIIK